MYSGFKYVIVNVDDVVLLAASYLYLLSYLFYNIWFFHDLSKGSVHEEINNSSEYSNM